VGRVDAAASPSIYFFRGWLRRGTCREGKRLSPRAKAKHRKSLKRARRRASNAASFWSGTACQLLRERERERARTGAFSSSDQRGVIRRPAAPLITFRHAATSLERDVDVLQEEKKEGEREERGTARSAREYLPADQPSIDTRRVSTRNPVPRDGRVSVARVPRLRIFNIALHKFGLVRAQRANLTRHVR